LPSASLIGAAIPFARVSPAGKLIVEVAGLASGVGVTEM
jgi:hypothetical protein